MYGKHLNQLLERVIAKAAENFITKIVNNHSGLGLLDDASITDPNYSSYDANSFPGTNLIAAKGPQCPEEMINFIRNTAYHPTKPIYHVVALGSIVTYEKETCQDFHDYMLKERITMYGPYQENFR